MRHPRLSIALMGLLLTAHANADSPVERIQRLQGDIDRASERGAFTRVQTLQTELAQVSAESGAFSVAARQYELLLAARPSKWERVRLSIELGKGRDALGDYGASISAYQ